MQPERVTRRVLPVLLALAAAGGAMPAIASAAQARRVPPLQDLPPTGTRFDDRVLTAGDVTATASAARTPPIAYAAGDGTDVRISVSSAYADAAPLAQSYATFLGSLDHGSELAKLAVVVDTPAEVVADCGGDPSVLACYDSSSETMYVPGEQSTIADRAGVTTAYVVAHEYGHHIATNRSNEPFPAIDYGPKYWASQELVCDGVLQHRLAPGDEGSGYAANPGEAWAETYAQLKYPGVAWSYTPLLQPTPASLAAARRDVTSPWTAGLAVSYRGSLGPRTTRRSFTFKLHLDGPASFKLRGPAGANYDLRVRSNGRTIATTSTAGSRDTLAYRAACRQTATETVTVTVLRRSGSGPFRLAVRYAG